MRILYGGGLNENDGTDIRECQSGSNFDLFLGDTDFRPRKPIDLKGTSTNSGSISGLMQLVKKDTTETTLVFEDDGVTPTIYQWDGASVFTSKRTINVAIGSKLRDVYFDLDDTITITDIAKLTPLLKWDGTTCSRALTGIYAGSPASVTGIVRSGTTATVTTAVAHSLNVGDLMVIAGANELDYNIEAEVLTVPTTTTYTYTVANSPVTPATGTITFDAGIDVYAKYAIMHDSRLWLFNVKAGTDTPHLMVASQFENIDIFDTASRVGDSGFSTGEEAFYMLSQNLKPINGVAVFNKELIISTNSANGEARLYRLTGNDSTDYAWVEYSLGSGAIADETMVNIGNDIAFMREGGNIELLSTTDRSDDVRVDDISRWIPNTVKDLTSAISVYDQSNQKVFLFAQDQVLVFYKDIYYGSELSPWSIYKTAHASKFNTSATKYMLRPGETTRSIYWGDDSGNIFDMNGAGFGDLGTTNIMSQRKSQIIEELDTKNNIIFGTVQYRRNGECELTLEFTWTDEFNTSNSIMVLKGPPPDDVEALFGGAIYFGGDVYFGQGFEFSDLATHSNFSPTGRGRSFTFNQVLDTSVRFKIDHIELNI